MPRNFMFTKEEIISAAVSLTREKGFQALTARALGERLGSSPKPIFGLFENMAEVQNEVLSAAYGIYTDYLKSGVESGEYPPYKASGMAYIRFAREEKELFKLLFMRDRSSEKTADNSEELKEIVKLLVKNLKISEEKARMFHLEMWIYVHGIAVMLATSYLEWQEDFISRVLTDAYSGLKCRYCKESEG